MDVVHFGWSYERADFLSSDMSQAALVNNHVFVTEHCGYI